MSIRIQASKDVIDNSEETKVHFIPAAVNKNGTIKIYEYFEQYTEEENGVLKNSIRGYPLYGCEMKLPETHQGVILQEKETLQVDNAERVLKFAGKFDKFMYWNYDKNPSDNDAYRKALHWIKVSDDLHSEVESLDVEDVKDEDNNVKN